MPPPLTLTNLRNYALQTSAELTLEGQGNAQAVGLSEVTWGKRLVRNITGFFSSTRNDGFMAAKVKVLETLQKAYGDELGERVFRANIGHVRESDGAHVSSRHHPITGAHIARMVAQADREILERYSSPENGGVRYGTNWCTPDRQPLAGVPERATSDWMLRKSAGMPGPTEEDPPRVGTNKRLDRRNMVLRAFVEGGAGVGFDPRATSFGRQLGGELRNSVRHWMDHPSNESQLTWTLDLNLDPDRPMTHTIGLRVDRSQPDRINVFDVNHGETTVPLQEFEAWIKAHVNANYNAVGSHLYRAQETMDSVFLKQDGEWKRHADLEVRPDRLAERLTVNMGILGQNPVTIGALTVSSQFGLDLNRMAGVGVTVDGMTRALSRNNVEPLVRSLVQGGATPEEDARAAFNLSLLINQNIWNTPNDLLLSQVKGLTGTGLLFQGEPLSETNVRRAEEGDGAPKICIDIKIVLPIKSLAKPGSSLPGLEDQCVRSSALRMSYSLEVSLAGLRMENGHQTFRVSPLTAELNVAPLLGQEVQHLGELEDLPPRNDLGLFPEGNGVVSARAIDVETVTGILAQAPDLTIASGSGSGPILEDEFAANIGTDRLMISTDGRYPQPLTKADVGNMPEKLGLTEQGLTNLSRLCSSRIGTILNDRFLDGRTGHLLPDALDNQPSRITLISVREGNRQFVDLEYRHGVPKALLEEGPVSVLHYFDGKPDGEGKWESVVRARVPIDEINERVPERFDMVHNPRFEWRPTDQQV